MVLENLTVVSAVIKPGIMVMLLLSFSAFSATTTTKKTSSSRGNEPPLLARPFAPSRFEKIVTNVVYYTVAFFSVHNSFVKWNNNLLHGKYKLFFAPSYNLPQLLLLEEEEKNYIKMQRVRTTT